MRDSILLGLLAVTFGTIVTAHLLIVLGLIRRSPRWHAPLALVVPPLAPYWAFRQRMAVRAGAWLVGLGAYVAVRVIALH